MFSNVAAPDRSSASPSTFVRPEQPLESLDSLFEHVPWFYAFCRERLFRDDTNRIISALWQNQPPPPGVQLIELGCGPGFYARELAQRFPQISVTGVDRSERQLYWARDRVNASAVRNCVFERVNILSLPCADASFDALVASRIFTVLPEQDRAVDEMFRVLKPGGRCFVAEPRFGFWASLPLFSMWLLARVMHSGSGYCEPMIATVLSVRAFEGLFNQLPWKSVHIWRDGHYQYALCEKG
jgi:ubiquinone/menaquinone biosynthesis C-methylase UbiE